MNGGSFASVALLSGKSGADIRDKVSRDVAPTWLTGVCYWPFVMALTFRVVPLRHRALSSAGFGVPMRPKVATGTDSKRISQLPAVPARQHQTLCMDGSPSDQAIKGSSGIRPGAPRPCLDRLIA